MMRSILLLACVACTARVTPTAPLENTAASIQTETATATESETAAPIEPASGPSLYDLPITLTTSTGAKVDFDLARGEPVLVSMFYASCSVACPLIISELQQTLAELPPGMRVRVLLVSFAAARDTPEKLQALAHERKLDDRFTLAAASDADARALAAVLGVKYRRLGSGEFAHGSTIVALDGEGREVARADSLGQRGALVRGLAALHRACLRELRHAGDFVSATTSIDP